MKLIFVVVGDLLVQANECGTRVRGSLGPDPNDPSLHKLGDELQANEGQISTWRDTMPVLTIASILASTTIAGVGEAEAKGCIKGAVVGGLAGHMIGHGVAGAVAGCAIGHHRANGDARRSRRLDRRTRAVMAALLVSPGDRPAPRPYGVTADLRSPLVRADEVKVVLASALMRGGRTR